MKKRIFILSLMISLITGLQAGVEHILPKPQQITTNASGSFNLAQSLRLILPTINSNDPAVNTELTNLITTNGGTVSESAATTIEVQLVASVTGAEFQKEAYSLNITSEKITIKATTLQGAYWATQTLWQLADNAGGYLTACSIIDWPAFSIRGYMQDIGRSYMEFDEIKKEIANLSRYKINVFHWHLTENQGWRLQSKLFPQLNANNSTAYTRHPGKFYTMAQARELVQWCSKHGVLLIPEMDMPGHSDAFTRVFGYNMQTTQGLATMKQLITEAIDSCFSTSPILHIGTDEVTMTMPNFVPEMVSLIRAKGLKIGTWSRGYTGYNAADIGLTQLWASSGTIIPGTPNVDSRYHYMNHFDDYADVVGMYNSSILEVPKQTSERVGVIMAVWNDRKTRTDRDIVIQNGVYPAVLATAERAWLGGGTYITTKGVMLDAKNTEAFRNFADWERRFLYHKANHLKNEPIAYVKQTNVNWRITDAFPNGGTLTTSFPPETQLADTYTYNGNTYGTRKATGAGIYLRHVWGTIIPTFYSSPQTNSTAYAYTWVYSPVAQTVGANIEFQNYGRSESDVPPRQGTWDYKGSRIWINDTEVMPPTWESQHTTRDNEIPLTNENASVRTPISVNLIQGWNKVLMKLPVGAFSISQVRLVKWMFSCVFVTPDGKNAVDGLIYSPEKSLNTSAEADALIMAIDNAEAFKNSTKKGTQPGEYPVAANDSFVAAITTARTALSQSSSDEQLTAAINELGMALQQYKSEINKPLASTANETIWYSLHTPERGTRYLAYKGDNVSLAGEVYTAGVDRQLWKIVIGTDGTYAIVSKVANSSISPASAFNTALNAQTGIPASGGWSFTPTFSNKTFIVTSGSVQMNQTNLTGFPIYNWGGGTNLTDTGCRYVITEASRVSTDVPGTFRDAKKVWCSNRRILIEGNYNKASLYAPDGRKLNLAAQQEPGLKLVSIDGVVHKVMVR